MKRIIVLPVLITVCLNVLGQTHEVHELKEIKVEGTISGGGNKNPTGADNKDIKSEKADGKSGVSKGAKETAKEIYQRNSLGGGGEISTGVQKDAILRELNDAKVQAAQKGKNADAKFFEKEKNRISKTSIKAVVVSPEAAPPAATPAPVTPAAVTPPKTKPKKEKNDRPHGGETH